MAVRCRGTHLIPFGGPTRAGEAPAARKAAALPVFGCKTATSSETMPSAFPTLGWMKEKKHVKKRNMLRHLLYTAKLVC